MPVHETAQPGPCSSGPLSFLKELAFSDSNWKYLLECLEHDCQYKKEKKFAIETTLDLAISIQFYELLGTLPPFLFLSVQAFSRFALFPCILVCGHQGVFGVMDRTPEALSSEHRLQKKMQ